MSGGRPRKGTRVGFQPSAHATSDVAPDVVAGLRFTIATRHGTCILVDFSDFPSRPLALAFTAIFRHAAGAADGLGAVRYAKHRVRACRSFLVHLRDHAPEVREPADLRAAHVDRHEAALAAAGCSEASRHAMLAALITALRAIDAERPGLLEQGLRERLAYVGVGPKGSCRPREAYSPLVARRLRDAARADVARLLRRVGAPLEEAGDDVFRRMLRRADSAIAEHGRIGNTHPALEALRLRRWRRGLPSQPLVAPLHGRHHLLAADLPPLLVLLSLETGLELECLKELAVDCLRDPANDTVGIAYLKRRARGTENKVLRVRDGGPGTPGGLLRRLIEITAAARRHVPGDSLWLYLHRGTLRAGVHDLRRGMLDAWIARHGLVDDGGRPLRLVLARLRKTHKALWYLKSEGHLTRFALGHSVEVAARHYADLPSLRPLHEAAVADAFAEVVAAATGTPTVVPPDLEATWRAAPELADGSVPHTDVGDLLCGGQDVWLAACAGFWASPFGRPGEPCPQPFWGCLECGNAVITQRKLPAVLAFLAFAEGERAGLSAEAWRLKFGRAHARITRQILPAFPEATVIEARRAAGAAALYLPPEAWG